MNLVSSPIRKLQGTLSVPGDKSISHRSVMLGAIAEGVTQVSGFLEGADCLATLHAFKAMGVEFEGPHDGELTIQGVGMHGLQTPSHALDLGNSGTSMRLLSGLLAGQAFPCTLTGDASLRSRPMQRIIKPLSTMGADINSAPEGRAPLQLSPASQLTGIDYHSPIASAQVKSAILLAGLYAQGKTSVTEPAMSRDHTERMLSGFGVELAREPNKVSLQGGQKLTATKVAVPGDISSAAFFMVAASIVPNSRVCLEHVGINPTRIGCINILRQMGANIELLHERWVCGEPVADILVTSAELRGIDIASQDIPLAIDEFPVLFIAAACAQGQTRLRNAEELRVKESDRIHAMAVGLQALGITCQEMEAGLDIQGGVINGGTVDSFTDHRIAMAFAIAGLVAKQAITISHCENITTSFPSFVDFVNQLGGHLQAK